MTFNTKMRFSSSGSACLFIIKIKDSKLSNQLTKIGYNKEFVKDRHQVKILLHNPFS